MAKRAKNINRRTFLRGLSLSPLVLLLPKIKARPASTPVMPLPADTWQHYTIQEGGVTRPFWSINDITFETKTLQTRMKSSSFSWEYYNGNEWVKMGPDSHLNEELSEIPIRGIFIDEIV